MHIHTVNPIIRSPYLSKLCLVLGTAYIELIQRQALCGGRLQLDLKPVQELAVFQLLGERLGSLDCARILLINSPVDGKAFYQCGFPLCINGHIIHDIGHALHQSGNGKAILMLFHLRLYTIADNL